MIKQGFKILLIVILAVLFFSAKCYAQEKELTTQVTHLAGSSIYLSVGSDDDIVQGDTLFVYRNEAFLGALIVQSVASKSLSAEFASDTFPLTRGQTITIRFQKPEISTAQEKPKQAEPTPPQKSLLDGQTKSPQKTYGGPKISGRISVGGSVLSSQTKWSSVQNNRTDRLFITPYTNLRASVVDLPGGLAFDASMAYSYRYSRNSTIRPTNAPRFYRLSVEKEFDRFPLTITAGRFYNRYEIFSGFWDGLMAKVGDRDNGIGFIAGYEPTRSDEGFQTDLPKYSVYTYHEFQWKHFRSSTELDFTAIKPSINLNDHIYLGAYQQFQIDRHRISVRLQADRNPLDKQWNFSQVMVRGALRLTDRLELHGGYNRRQPYRLYNIDNPISYWRTEVSAGTNLRLASGSAGVDVSQISSELSPTAYSFSGYVHTYRTALWDLGFSINGQYWFNDNYQTIRMAPGIDRDFNNIHLSLGYEFYQTDYFSGRYHTHTADLSAMINLNSQLHLQLNFRSGFSELFINNSGQISIWRSF